MRDLRITVPKCRHESPYIASDIYVPDEDHHWVIGRCSQDYLNDWTTPLSLRDTQFVMNWEGVDSDNIGSFTKQVKIITSKKVSFMSTVPITRAQPVDGSPCVGKDDKHKNFKNFPTDMIFIFAHPMYDGNKGSFSSITGEFMYSRMYRIFYRVKQFNWIIKLELFRDDD